MKAQLRIRQTGSTIGQVEHTRKVVKGLGLRGLGSVVTVANTPSFRGMVKKVLHLVSVEELDATVAGAKAKPTSKGTKD
jgi:large subunit ribosomal protein L30